MSPLRSPRALVAAVLAGVIAYAYVAVRGAPGPIAWMASIGESAVDARGGVVLEVKAAEPLSKRVRAELRRVIDARLAAQDTDVAIDDVDARTLRVTAAGVLPERADGIAASVQLRGQ